MTYKVVPTFKSVDRTSKWKLLSCPFLWRWQFTMLFKVLFVFHFFKVEIRILYLFERINSDAWTFEHKITTSINRNKFEVRAWHGLSALHRPLVTHVNKRAKKLKLHMDSRLHLLFLVLDSLTYREYKITKLLWIYTPRYTTEKASNEDYRSLNFK